MLGRLKKQKTPTNKLAGFSLEVGDDLLSHILLQYHRR